ncbi:MAG TPA: DNA glycosylase [Candidatus Bathyarchaeia archaeon]|nr:DNA glycosylase [Candidatus Bathyarchaeia archaeon]
MNLDSCPFDLDVTLRCGQVFRWDKRGDWWYGVVGDHPLKVRQSSGLLEFAGVNETFVGRYFSLDHDLQKIGKEVGKDAHVKAALSEFWGLRIVGQPPWECLVSFICATYKSVAAIRQMLLRLSAKFGEKAVFEGRDFHAFPTAERLAKASLRELEDCGLGYRAKYVLETSKMVCAGDLDFNDLLRMDYLEAKEALCELPGVGSKVADCVLLFSLGKLEAFPVDVWVKRIILKYYSEHFPAGFVEKLSCQKGFSDADYERLNGFGREYFGAYAGYAQEYLYHYERLANRKIEKGLRGIEQEAKHR